MRIYDFQEYQRYHRIAREFGWTMREYKEVMNAVDSLFEDLEFKSDPESARAAPHAADESSERSHKEKGDSASAQT